MVQRKQQNHVIFEFVKTVCENVTQPLVAASCTCDAIAVSSGVSEMVVFRTANLTRVGGLATAVAGLGLRCYRKTRTRRKYKTDSVAIAIALFRSQVHLHLSQVNCNTVWCSMTTC